MSLTASLVGGTPAMGPGRLPVHRKDAPELLATVGMAGPEEIGRAADAAVEAARGLARMPAGQRAAILRKAGELLAGRRDPVARTLALEAGKPIRTARVEVERCLHTLAAGAEEATRLDGLLLPLDAAAHAEGRIGLLRRFPLGPVLGITPFNFPLNLVAHKMVPALAAGCPIVLKPASATPLSALSLGGILVEAGAPPGTVSVIPSRVADAEALVGDPRMRLLSFTGSAEVGWRLRGRAGTQRVVLELGGNAGVIVHDDADLEAAVPRIANGAFGFAGQSCISVQRVLVHRTRHEALLGMLAERARSLVLGDVLDEATDVGPMIDEPAAARAEESVKEACRRGATLVAGGGRRGAWLEPTVLSGVPRDARAWCQEMFAPVVAVEPYERWEDALSAVDASEFGLQAGIFTRDVDRVMQAWCGLEVGGLMVNEVPTWRVDHMPYGGAKASGLGREGVRYAMDHMTEPRLLVLDGWGGAFGVERT